MAKNAIIMSAAGAVAAIVLVFALSSASNLSPGGNLYQASFPNTGGPQVFSKINTNSTGNMTTFAIASTQNLKKFDSIAQLQAYIDQSVASSQKVSSQSFAFYDRNAEGGVAVGRPMAPEYMAPGGAAPQAAVPGPNSQASKDQAAPTAGSVSPEYSATNVQVKNVDEPDFLKNDGKYVYILSGDKLSIIDGYPAQNASVVVKVGLDIPQGQTLQNMFLDGNKLAIFYQDYSPEYIIPQYDYLPQPISTPRTHIVIMDVSDKSNPKVLHDYKVDGNYNDARMIGGYAYLITTSYINDYNHPILPRVMESSRIIATPDVYYFDNPVQSFSFTIVTSVNIAGEGITSKSYLMDQSSTIYASENNLYITYQKYMPWNYYESTSKDRFFKAVVPLLPSNLQSQIIAIDHDDSLTPSEKWDKVSGLMQDYYNKLSESEKSQLYDKIQQSLADYDAQLQKSLQTTVIHKLSIGANGTFDYVAKGEVSGRLLNQFSMDENGTKFRIATTSEYYSQYRNYQYNNVYVLDGQLHTVGSLEQIALNESIYSARFIGDRLYLVTFRQVDPFFVIDLSQDQPKILGKLKLPGYSNYLHPYDETHIIGIGRDTQDNGYGGVSPLGVKLALFDVSDVSNPVTVGTYKIGGVGTDSEVLYDHKALLFDKSKNILSIPISISQYGGPVPLPAEGAGGSDVGNSSVSSNDVQTAPSDAPVKIPPRPSPNFWRGFYVFGVDPHNGFALKAKIEHYSNQNDNGFYPNYGLQGGRSFYIGGVLYTVSVSNVMKMNSLADPTQEINKLDLGASGGLIKYAKSPAAENVTSGNASAH